LSRRAERSRSTKETNIEVSVCLDGKGLVNASTGLPFFDHMLEQVEDVGIVVGEALAEALGDKAGVRRFASISVPLDEALVDIALDLSGRAYLAYEVSFAPEQQPLGDPGFDPQLAEEFFRAFASGAALTLHVRMVTGRNAHHVLEATFKGVARCLYDAVRVDSEGVPSTKGTLGTKPPQK
jgi:imidazoleglycerol-phosphate dehydratase